MKAKDEGGEKGMPERRRERAWPRISLWLHSCGSLSAISYGVLAWRSQGVVPVSLTVFFSCLCLTWTAVIAVFFLLKNSEGSLSKATIFTCVLLWATVFRLIGIWANPILAEDDFYRFLWDGYRFAETGDPYTGNPRDFWDDEEVPEPFSFLLYDINYPELPTIYGPVMEVVFLAGYLLEPGSLTILKCLFVVFEGILLFFLSRFLSMRWFAVAAWCPLLVFETSFQAHPDMIGVSLMVAAVWATRRQLPWTGMILLGLATCAKPFAVLLWPFVVEKGRWFRQGVLLAAVIGVIYLPFVVQDSDSGLTSLGAMATGWEFNSSGYALLKSFCGEQARLVSLVGLMATYLYLLRAHWRQQGGGKQSYDLVYGALFFFSPVLNPWYLFWLLPFAMMNPKAWSLTALAVVSLSYATGLNTGRRALAEFEIVPWVQGLEFGLILAAAAYDIYRSARKNDRWRLLGAS